MTPVLNNRRPSAPWVMCALMLSAVSCTAARRATFSRDGSAWAEFLALRLNAELGAGDAECDLRYRDGQCGTRYHQCTGREDHGFSMLSWERTYARFDPCENDELTPERMKAKFGLTLGPQVGLTRTPVYPLHSTDNPNIFVEVHTSETGVPWVYEFYAVPAGSDWRTTIPYDTPEARAARIAESEAARAAAQAKAIDEAWRQASGPVVCPNDPAERARALEALTTARAEVSPTQDAERWYRTHAFWGVCGHADEALDALLGPQGRTRLIRDTPEAADILVMTPALRQATFQTVVDAQRLGNGAEKLTDMAQALIDTVSDPDSVRDDLRNGSYTFSPLHGGHAVRPWAQALMHDASETACWQAHEAETRRALRDGRLGSATLLVRHCFRDSPEQVGISTLGTPTAWATNPRELRTQLGVHLLERLGFDVTSAEEVTSKYWVLHDETRPITAVTGVWVDSGAKHKLPAVTQRVEIDTRDVTTRYVEASVSVSGPSERELRAARDRELKALGAEAQKLMARRDSLLSSIDRATAAIENARPVEYRGTTPTTTPTGTVTTTREWTDRYGIRHTERSTRQQGGQTWGGVVTTMPADTSDARERVKAAEAELREVDAQLEALRAKAGRSEARPTERHEPQRVAAHAVYQGIAHARLVFELGGRQFSEPLDVDVSTNFGPSLMYLQLADSAHKQLTERWRRLGDALVTPRLEKMLATARGTPAELAVERSMLLNLTNREHADDMGVALLRLLHSDLEPVVPSAP